MKHDSHPFIHGCKAYPLKKGNGITIPGQGLKESRNVKHSVPLMFGTASTQFHAFGWSLSIPTTHSEVAEHVPNVSAQS